MGDDPHALELAFAPRPARGLFAPEAISAELERLVEQQQDGGWPVEFASYSPAAALEWRGHMTVRALSILRRNYVFHPARLHTADGSGAGSPAAVCPSGIASCPGGATRRRRRAPSAPVTAKAAAARNAAL
jgi:hypothetical protein